MNAIPLVTCWLTIAASHTDASLPPTPVNTVQTPLALNHFRIGPILAISKRLIDLGTISDDRDIVRTVSISNTGTAELNITNIQTTCGCTAAGLSVSTLSPGEIQHLMIRFRPQGKLDEKREYVTLTSNDPKAPTVRIEVRAFVDPIVRVVPALASLGDLSKGQDVSETITIQGRGEDFEITGVFWDGSKGVSAKIIDERAVVVRDEPRKEYVIEVRFGGQQEVGSIRGTLMIRTNEERNKIVRVAVLGRVLQDLRAIPPVIGTTAPQNGDNLQIAVTLRDQANRPFRITSIEDSSRNELPISWTLVPSSDNNADEQQVIISFTEPRQVGLLRGAFRIQTDLSDDAAVTVPFTILTTNNIETTSPTSGGQR